MGISVHYLSLQISEQEWLRYYSGEATHIYCKDTNGKTIAIAARHFRKFTMVSGICGMFKLTLKDSRFISLEKLHD